MQPVIRCATHHLATHRQTTRSQWRKCRGPSSSRVTAKSAPSPVKLPPVVVLLATEIRQQSRLPSLQRCLASLSSQTTPTRVYIAWHAATPRLRAATEDVLEGFVAASPVRPRLLEAATAQTQLQHLEALHHAVVADIVGSPIDTFVLFSDDDDISAPGRVAAYAEVVQKPSMPRKVAGLTCQRVAMRCSETRPSSRHRAIRSADDVDAALSDGDVEVREFHEYWCYCVRLDALCQFFRRTPPGLLAHRLADLRLRQWLAASGPLPYVEQALGRHAPKWAYFYDRDSVGHAHAHASHHAHDPAIAAIDAERATRLGRGLPPGIGDRGEDGLPVSLLALMRDVGEMATCIGFDGPKLGVQLPRAARQAEIRSLLLEALRHPDDAWSRMPHEMRERFVKVAAELGDELLMVAESFMRPPV